jgi:hypothetical protein
MAALLVGIETPRYTYEEAVMLANRRSESHFINQQMGGLFRGR